MSVGAASARAHVAACARAVRVLLGLALATLAAAGCSASTAAPTPAGIVTAPGERFTIALDANRSTGFQWELGRPLDEEVVRFVDSTYEQTTPGVGAGGKEIWTFDAVAPGWAKIELVYRRPWEEMAPSRIAVYSIEVAP
jgi:inhibitor of cysteine peptidase